MHQPGHRTPPIPIEQITRIASDFFEGCRKTVLSPTLTEAGFSGSTTYIFTHKHTGRRYVLKQLPRHLSLEQILWTQNLATFTHNQGYALLPVAIHRHGGDKFLPDATPKITKHTDGSLWQCLEYIDGKPCEVPQKHQTLLGAKALATFHKVASAFQMPLRRSLCGWRRRTQQLCTIITSEPELPESNKVHNPLHSELRALYIQFVRLIHAPETIEIIRGTLKHKMSAIHQPALKDCRWEHFLFSESRDRLTGIIDIDGAGWDDPAVDMARLLGSWQLENQTRQEKLVDLWPEAFQKYSAIVEPGADFSFRVQILHDTGIICGMDRWFHWIFKEKRQFPNMKLVLRRITHLLHAAPAAICRLERSQTPLNRN